MAPVIALVALGATICYLHAAGALDYYSSWTRNNGLTMTGMRSTNRMVCSNCSRLSAPDPPCTCPAAMYFTIAIYCSSHVLMLTLR